MLKQLCKNPKCINNAINGKPYCRVHTKELLTKSEIYLKELNGKHR